MYTFEEAVKVNEITGPYKDTNLNFIVCVMKSVEIGGVLVSINQAL